MDDLISRAAACECIGKMIHEYREKGEYALADGMILARRYGIKCLPAVDAAPVVRCKNCVKWDRDTIRQNSNDAGWWNEAECKMLAARDGWNEIDRYVSADFYCADGERRDDE